MQNIEGYEVPDGCLKPTAKRLELTGRQADSVRRRIEQNHEKVVRCPSLPEPCWEWTGYKEKAHSGEYRGRLGVAGRMVYVYRAAFATYVGPIPAGLIIGHRCDNPICCNPSHLMLTTTQEDLRRAGGLGRMRPWKKRKLDANLAREVKSYPAGVMATAEHFGISIYHVSNIRAGRAWPNV